MSDENQVMLTHSETIIQNQISAHAAEIIIFYDIGKDPKVVADVTVPLTPLVLSKDSDPKDGPVQTKVSKLMPDAFWPPGMIIE